LRHGGLVVSFGLGALCGGLLGLFLLEVSVILISVFSFFFFWLSIGKVLNAYRYAKNATTNAIITISTMMMGSIIFLNVDAFLATAPPAAPAAAPPAAPVALERMPPADVPVAAPDAPEAPETAVPVDWYVLLTLVLEVPTPRLPVPVD
jgi:hypothetical protein